MDTQRTEHLSVEVQRRRQELVELLQRFKIASNWTIDSDQADEYPSNAELTVEVPKVTTRRELLLHLRQISAGQRSDGRLVRSVVFDPQEARRNWELLVRQGYVIARPRTTEATTRSDPSILRGGLWMAPLSCSFVGGSRRSVRTLFGLCQRRLVESSSNRKVFHLNVEIGNQRDSWLEECQAIRALLETADNQRQSGRLRSVCLSELPNMLTKKPTQPMLSILKRAA